MTPIEKKRRAVLLGRDRILVGRGHDPDLFDLELEPARRSLIGIHVPGHRQRGLLRQVLCLLEDLWGQIRPEGRALHRPGPIPDLQEQELPARPLSREPTPDRDHLSGMGCDLRNVRHHHGRVKGAHRPNCQGFRGIPSTRVDCSQTVPY